MNSTLTGDGRLRLWANETALRTRRVEKWERLFAEKRQFVASKMKWSVIYFDLEFVRGRPHCVGGKGYLTEKS